MSTATGISFATLRQLSPYICKIFKPVMLRGKHGVGKSEVVYAIAKDLNMPVVERRASQMTEGDLIGLPSIDTDSEGRKVSPFNMPDGFHSACKAPVVLFHDELDRGTIEVRQGFFEFADSRKIFGKHLHPGTLVFAAVNGGVHGSQYQVADMDPAELSRWTVFDLEPTHEDWLEWGKIRKDGVANICDEIREYISTNPKHLHHDGDYEPNKVYPNPRSWKRFNDAVTMNESEMLQKSGPLLVYLAMGFLGMETAIHFNDFIANYDRRVTVEDVIVKGKLDLVKGYDITRHCAMIEKVRESKLFNKELSKDSMQNLADYFVCLPSEAAFLLWGVLGNFQAKNKTLMPTLHKTNATDGTNVGERMAEIFRQRAEVDNTSKEALKLKGKKEKA